MGENGKAASSLKVIAVAVSFVAAIISGAQVYTAIQNNRLVEAQTVESYIPHLMNSESRDYALLAMNRYVDRDVVNEMASMLKSQAALKVLSAKGTSAEKEASQKVLAKLDEERFALVNDMFSDEKTKRIAATTALIRNWEHNEALLQESLTLANKKPEHKSGVINVLVLWTYFDREILVSYSNELNDFFNAVKNNGDQTRSYIAKLREIMGDTNKEVAAHNQ